MKIKKIFLTIALFLSVSYIPTIDASHFEDNAYSNYLGNLFNNEEFTIEIQSDEVSPAASWVCDSTGCYTTVTGSYKNSVYRYAQADYSDPLYNSEGNPCYSTDSQGNTTYYYIDNAGCAVTSMAMIINDMAGYSTARNYS